MCETWVSNALLRSERVQVHVLEAKENSSQYQMQSIVLHRLITVLMLQPKQQHLCQPYGSTLCCILLSQHPPSEEKCGSLLLRGCMGQDLIHRYGKMQRTSELCVVTTSLLVSIFARKQKSSVWFTSILKNACQFFGIALHSSTHLLLPFPLLLRVSAFKLSGLYTSQ